MAYAISGLMVTAGDYESVISFPSNPILGHFIPGVTPQAYSLMLHQ